MNLALGALLILILILPGIIFRIAFLKSDSLKGNVDTTILGELIFIVLAASFIHCLFTFTIEWTSHYRIRFDQIYYLIVGAKEAEAIQFGIIKSSLIVFNLYTLAACTFGVATGIGFQRLVIHYNLDNKYAFLRLSNEWERLLSGRVLGRGYKNRLEFIQVDVVTTSGDGSDLLYCGILEKFTLNSKVGLENIYLSSVYRRSMRDDYKSIQELTTDDDSAATQVLPATSPLNPMERKKLDERYYNMLGDYFMIPMKEVKNINITYYTFEKQDRSVT